MSIKYTVDIKPRFRDLDGMGHMNNSVFITYLEIARTDWFLEEFSIATPKEFDFIIARVEMDFKGAIGLNALVRVEMIVTDIGSKSWKFSYELTDVNTNAIYASAKSVQVAYDYSTGKSKMLSEKYISILNKYKF